MSAAGSSLRAGSMLRVQGPHGKPIFACVFNHIDATQAGVFATIGGRNAIIYRIESHDDGTAEADGMGDDLAAAAGPFEAGTAGEADGRAQEDALEAGGNGNAVGRRANGGAGARSKAIRQRKRKRGSPGAVVGELTALQRYIDADEDENLFTCEWVWDEATHHSLLAVGGEHRQIKLIDVHTSRVVSVLRGHGAPIYNLRFLPNTSLGSDQARMARPGRPAHCGAQGGAQAGLPSLLASASRDESVRLWHVRAGQCVAVFAGERGHLDAVLSVDFSPCCSAIASAGVDGTIKLWSIGDADVLSRISAAEAIAEEASRARADAHPNGHGVDALTAATQRWTGAPPAVVQFPLWSVCRMHLIGAAAPQPESSVATPTSESSLSPVGLLAREAPGPSSVPIAPASQRLPQGLRPQQPSHAAESSSRGAGRSRGTIATPWAVRSRSDISGEGQRHGGRTASGKAACAAKADGPSLAYVDLVRFVHGGRLLSRGIEGCAALWESPLPSANRGSMGAHQAGKPSASAVRAAAVTTPEAPVAYGGTEQRGAEQPAGFRAVRVVGSFPFHATDLWFLRQQLDPTNRLLAVGNYQGQIRVWRIDHPTDEPLGTLALPLPKGKASAHRLASSVRCTAISARMRYLACGCEDGSVAVAELCGHLPARAFDEMDAIVRDC